MFLKINRIDFDGYNGRDHHPRIEDQGKTVRVVGMELTHWSDQGCDTNLATTEFGNVGEPSATDLVEMLNDKDHLEMVWFAYTEDGRKLELMGHEVEMVSL